MKSFCETGAGNRSYLEGVAMHNILVCIFQQREVQILEHGLQRGLLVHCDLEPAVDVGLNCSTYISPRVVTALMLAIDVGLDSSAYMSLDL